MDKITIDVSYKFLPPDYIKLERNSINEMFVLEEEDKEELRQIIKTEIFYFIREKLKSVYELNENFTVD